MTTRNQYDSCAGNSTSGISFEEESTCASDCSLVDVHLSGSRNLSQKLLQSVLRIVCSPYNPQSDRLGDHYKLGSTLGKGTYGKVYRARLKIQAHTYGRPAAEKVGGRSASSKAYIKSRLDFPFACKVVAKEMDGEPTLDVLNRELALLRECRHEHVVQLVENFETPTNYYIMMRRCYGDVMQLQEQYRLQGEGVGVVPLSLVRTWAWQLCSALAHVHDCGVIHRDVKPANLMLKSKGMEPDIVLGDFGFACTIEEVAEGEAPIRGTPLYMSPEAMHGDRRAQTPAGDAWAAGVTLYELVTSTHPFKNNIAQSKVAELIKVPMGESEDTLAWQRALFRKVAATFRECEDYVATFEKLAIAVTNENIIVPVDSERFQEAPLLRELVQRLLCRDEKLRATLGQVMTLKWYQL